MTSKPDFQISPIELLALRKAALVLKALGLKMDSYRTKQEAKVLAEVCGEVADRYEIYQASKAQPEGHFDQ